MWFSLWISLNKIGKMLSYQYHIQTYQRTSKRILKPKRTMLKFYSNFILHNVWIRIGVEEESNERLHFESFLRVKVGVFLAHSWYKSVIRYGGKCVLIMTQWFSLFAKKKQLDRFQLISMFLVSTRNILRKKVLVIYN